MSQSVIDRIGFEVPYLNGVASYPLIMPKTQMLKNLRRKKNDTSIIMPKLDEGINFIVKTGEVETNHYEDDIVRLMMEQILENYQDMTSDA